MNDTKQGTGEDIAQLLQEYRRLSRSKDNWPKIVLLRKIVKQVPDAGQNFADILKSLEAERIHQLTDAAKEAIISKDFATLATINEQLSSPDWSVSPHPEVLAKIKRVLEGVQKERTAQQAAKIMEAINDAYSSFDLKALEDTTQRWHQLVDSQQLYTPDQFLQKQLQEAEAYLQEQRKKQEHDRQVKHDLDTLQMALEKDWDMEDINKLYLRLTMEEADIPEELLIHYRNYKEAVEDVQRRNRKMKLLMRAVIIVIIVGIAVAVISHVLLKKKEQEWVQRITISMQEAPSQITWSLMDELATSSKIIRQRPSILELEAKLQVKTEQEKKHRQTFKEMAETIRTELKDYAKNKDSLFTLFARIKEYVVDDQEGNVYLELEHALKVVNTDYVNAQNKRCESLSQQGMNALRDTIVAVNNFQFDQAHDLLQRAFSCRDQIVTMQDVDEPTRIQALEPLQGLLNLEQKLTNRETQFKAAEQVVMELKRCDTPQELLKRCTRFLTDFPHSRHTPMVEVLTKQLLDIPSTDIEAQTGIYSYDRKRLERLLDAFQDTLLAQRKYLENEYTKHLEQPSYAVVARGDDGTLYDIFFDNQATRTFNWMWHDWKKKTTCSFHTLISDKGTSRRIIITLAPDSHDLEVNFEGETARKATLVSPKPFAQKVPLWQYKAPHVLFLNTQWEIYRKLTVKSDSLTVERTFHKLVNNLVNEQPNINPYLKLSILQKLLTPVCKNYPANYGYTSMLAQVNESLAKVPQHISWINPLDIDSIKTRQVLTQEVQKLKEIKLFPCLEEMFYCQLLTSTLKLCPSPAGYLTLSGKHFMLSGLLANNDQNSGELWQKMDRRPYWKIVGTFKGKTVTLRPNAAKTLKPMTVLYSPMIASPSQDLENQFRDWATSLHIEDIQWPHTWPAR